MTTAAFETATVSTSSARMVAMRWPAPSKRESPRLWPIQSACVPMSKASVFAFETLSSSMRRERNSVASLR
jgi:hypothetical protein